MADMAMTGLGNWKNAFDSLEIEEPVELRAWERNYGIQSLLPQKGGGAKDTLTTPFERALFAYREAAAFIARVEELKKPTSKTRNESESQRWEKLSAQEKKQAEERLRNYMHLVRKLREALAAYLRHSKISVVHRFV